MTFLGDALSSLPLGGSEPRLTDCRGEKNAKSLYGLSRLCNGLPGSYMDPVSPKYVSTYVGVCGIIAPMRAEALHLSRPRLFLRNPSWR